MNWEHEVLKNSSKIDTVHSRAMKVYPGEDKFTPSDALQGKLNWESSKDRRMLRIVNY